MESGKENQRRRAPQMHRAILSATRVWRAAAVATAMPNVACASTVGWRLGASAVCLAQMAIRPEYIGVDVAGRGQCGSIADVIEDFGADTFVLFDRGDAGLINVRISARATLKFGDIAGLSFDPTRAVFSARTVTLF